jgi:hypothetical protein
VVLAEAEASRMGRRNLFPRIEIEEERNMSGNNGLFVELKRDELQKMEK